MLEFGQYFAADVLQRVQSWILIEMLKLGLVNILNFKFSRDGDVWLRFWSKCLVEILKMKFDQDLCLNLWYDPIGYFGKMNSTLGSVVPLAMFCIWVRDYMAVLLGWTFSLLLISERLGWLFFSRSNWSVVSWRSTWHLWVSTLGDLCCVCLLGLARPTLAGLPCKYYLSTWTIAI